MARVLAVMKVFPEGVEVDLEALKEKLRGCLPETATIRNIEEAPVAFGLVALRIYTVLEEVEGGTDSVEAAMASVEGVSQVQLEHLTRV